LLKVRPFLLGGENRIMTNSVNPIRKMREEKRLSQSDLALLVGVSQPTISQFEIGGVIPSESQIKKVTEILGIGPETLNKELRQFYEARKKELKKRIEEVQRNAEILL